ncbi:MFS transporter, partial [Mycobacterium tuberculosis]|nr:MFS transporter [Mycobacterium tuberculosis]
RLEKIGVSDWEPHANPVVLWDIFGEKGHPVRATVSDLGPLLLARLLTGVGLGAALPNLIALTSEAAGSRFHGRAVSLMYCGVPIGAALAAALGFSGLAAAWQIIFWIGGVVPLLLIPLLMRWLPESQAFQRAEASVPLRTLFAPGQAAATLLLWLGYFFTLLVVYM